MNKRFVAKSLCGIWCVVDTRPDDPEFCIELKNGKPLFFPKIVWTISGGRLDDRIKAARKKAREMNKNDDQNRKSR